MEVPQALKIFLSIVHIALCIALIAVVMLQTRKTGGFTGSFGGAGTQADTSGTWQRMTGLTKITVGLSLAFMLLSLIICLVR